MWRAVCPYLKTRLQWGRLQATPMGHLLTCMGPALQRQQSPPLGPKPPPHRAGLRPLDTINDDWGFWRGFILSVSLYHIRNKTYLKIFVSLRITAINPLCINIDNGCLWKMTVLAKTNYSVRRVAWPVYHEEAASSARHGPTSAFPSGDLEAAEMPYVHFRLQHTAY